MSLAAPHAPRFAPSATDREAICDALADVALDDGTTLTVTAYPPMTPTPFAAWPRWAVSNYSAAGRLAAVADHEFDVFVVLPASSPDVTTEVADDLLDRVIGALWSLGRITTAQPVQVLFDTTKTAAPALQIRVIPHLC